METNKILGAVILALLLAAVFSKVVDMAIHPEFPDELAYKIEIPEGGISLNLKKKLIYLRFFLKLHLYLPQRVWRMVKRYLKNASCHTQVKGGENKVGPAMWGVVNRSKGR